MKKFLIISFVTFIILLALSLLVGYLRSSNPYAFYNLGALQIPFIPLLLTSEFFNKQVCSPADIGYFNLFSWLVSIAAVAVIVAALIKRLVLKEKFKSQVMIFLTALAIVAYVASILITVLFSGASRPNPNLFQTCLSAPNSPGCSSCLSCDKQLCNTCEKSYQQVALEEIDISAVPSECSEQTR